MVEEQTVNTLQDDHQSAESEKTVDLDKPVELEKPVQLDKPVELEKPVERKYAGFWIRFAAYLLDSIAIFAVNVLIYAMLGVDLLEPPLSLQLVLMLLSYFYAVAMTVKWGQTLGKMAVGIKVVREDDSPNGWGTILLRETVGKILSALILCVGYLLAAFDRRKQSLHDRIARTFVVKAD
jgi:uncharacterized RDD family membrane protein YckC